MMRFRACPHCHTGAVSLETDRHGQPEALWCVNCSWQRPLAAPETYAHERWQRDTAAATREEATR